MQNSDSQTNDNLKRTLSQYAKPTYRQANIQLLNTILPYFACFAAMYFAQQYSILLSLLLAIPTGLFLIRIFILEHDCGHFSFVPGKKANDRIGYLLGLLTFTPLLNWRDSHNMHHATSGNLDRRLVGGDVWLLTREEYDQASFRKKLEYRIYRNPIVLFIIGPVIFFLVRRRFPIDVPAYLKKVRYDVYKTNLGILLVYGPLGWLIGFKALLLIIVPVAAIGSTIGVWLFYVQHQFDNAYWVKASEWNYVSSGIEGSSYYDLPAWLNWFTADIAVHHIHHVDSRIPNYNLRKCMVENQITPKNKITLRQSLRLMHLKYWDESKKQLVGYGA
jgi:acyl-lipid omega-6 desaturase (Delta-12 desaturase)